MKRKNPIVIIGSGHAGFSLVKALRALNKTMPLVMVTASDGSHYSKPLLSTCFRTQKAPHHTILASKKEMEETMGDFSIYHQVRVEHIDPDKHEISLSCGQMISYQKLILATGSVPLNLPALEKDNNVKSVNSLDEYKQFVTWLEGKRHIAILGTGLVGCEFMSDLIHTDKKISVIGLDMLPLQTFMPKELSETFAEIYNKAGVNWHLNRTIKKLSLHQNKDANIQLDNDELVHCDGVLSAIGIKPNIELAQQSELKVNKGILVNSQLETSKTDIYALGDCAEINSQWLPYIAPIQFSARTLANILCGKKDKINFPIMPVIIKTPACKVVALPVPLPYHNKGQWIIEGKGIDKAAFYHVDGEGIKGFALIGRCTSDIRDTVTKMNVKTL